MLIWVLVPVVVAVAGAGWPVAAANPLVVPAEVALTVFDFFFLVFVVYSESVTDAQMSGWGYQPHAMPKLV